MTITSPGGTEVDSYDTDGNMMHEVSTDGGDATKLRHQDRQD
jgi:hypothetical protein